jgi:cell division protein ZapA
VKQIEVTILGQSYLLGCPDGGESLLQRAVARVDQEMSNIRDAGKVKARERMAVLAALNLAYLLADHENAERAPARKSSSKAAAEPAAHDGGVSAEVSTEVSAEVSAQVAELVRRIDTALGDDGHLL